MTSLRKYLFVLLVAAALIGLAASPAMAQVAVNCSGFPSTMTLGSSYQLTCSATGGTAPYNWSLSGTYPPSMSYQSFSNGTEFELGGSASTAGSYSVSVTATDANQNSGSSSAFAFTVGSSTSTGSGTITLSYISPNTITEGQPTTIELFGTNFTSNTVVYFNGTILPATFIGSGELYVAVPAYLAIAGTLPVYVHDPTNGSSGTVYETVSGTSTGTGSLQITQIVPSSAQLDSPAVTVTIYGSGFSAGSELNFGTLCEIGTTYQGSTQLTATIPANCLTTAETVNVSVGSSNSVTFTIGGSTTSSGITLSSYSPTTIAPGVTQTLQLYGSNFTPNTQVYFNNTYVTSSYVNSANISAYIPGSLVTSGSLPLYVRDPTYGQSQTLYVPITGSTQSGSISISSISPTSVTTAGTGFTLFVYGSNFTASTLLHFNNNVLAVTYENSSTIYTTIPSSYVTSGSIPVYVSDPVYGTSNITYLTVGGTSSSGIITLSAISPTTATAGTAFQLFLYGSNFTTSSIIHFNNNALAASYVSSSELYTTIPGSLVTGGTLQVYLTDPSTGTSNSQYVTVNGSTSTGSGVTLSSLSPSAIAAGSQAFVLTLFGSNFSNGALVTFGSGNFSGTLVNSSEMQVTVPAQYLVNAGTVYVSVGGSNSLPFTVTGSSTGTLSVSCNPSTGPATVNAGYSQTCTVSGGTAPYTWTVSGLPSGLSQSAYTGASTVTISGTPSVQQSYSYVVSVTDSSSTRLTGSTTVSGTVNAATSGYSITSLSPTSFSVGSAATTLNVYGNGFTGSSQVYFNGTPIPTSYVSSTQLSATVPATSLTTSETAAVSVYTSGVYTNTMNVTVGSGSTTTSGGLTVNCSPGVGPQTQFVLYTMICTASGGNQPYVWQTTGLPSFLALSATTGSSITVTGTPTGIATYNFTLKVNDSSSPALTGSLQIAGQVGATTSGGGVSITSLSPSSAPQNSSAVTLTIIGSGFTNASQVTFASIPIVTTFISGSELLATIPSNLLTQPFAAQVTVSTQGVGTSNALSFIIGTNVSNPVSITCTPGVGPTAPNTYYTQSCNANGGTGPFTWSIASGTLPAGLALSTTSGVQTSITGYTTLNGTYSYTVQVVDSSSPPNVGTAVFAGQTGSGVGGTSGLSLTSLSPSSIAPGAGNTTLTINGSGFSTSSVAYFNTTALATTYLNTTQLTATIPSNLLITASTASITVQSLGVTSNALTLSVNTGSSTAITISCNPSVGPAGPGDQYSTTCTASGGKAPYAWLITSGFLPPGLVLGNSTSSTVTISGVTFLSGSYSYTLQVTDSSTPVQTASYPFSGTLPTGEGGGFGGTITSMNPVSAPVNSGQFTLTVTGTGFQSGLSFVTFGAYSLITTYISPTELTAIVPASVLTTPGSQLVTVETAGVGSTNQVGFLVNGASAVSVTPTALTFNYALGGATPAPQILTISTTSTVTGYSLSSSGVANAINWLSATPISGTIPGTVTVIVAPTGLAIGTYTGSVTVTGFGTGGGITIPVTLNILSTPGLKTSATTLSFTSATGTSAPTQTLSITATDGQTPIPFNITGVANNGGTWLSVTPSSGTTPATFTVTANAGSLAAATYSGQINVVPTGSYGATLAIPVTFTVTGPISLTASPTSLSFNGVTGQSNPAAQTINLTSTSATSYTVAATTASGGSWLTATASNGTTPGSISVSTNLSGLAAGTYTGTVTVTAPGTTNSPLAVPVTLTVANPAPLTTSPSSLTFSYQLGGSAPASQTLNLTAPSGSSAALNYSVAAATTSGGNWLSATPTSGTTPSSVSVSVNTANLAAGSYSGTLTITASGVGPATINVSLTVSAPSPTLSVSPSSLTFSATAGGSAPAPQTVAVTTTNSTTANYTVTASSSGNWLTATASGTTPGSVSVSVNPGSLPIGQYTGSLSIASPGATNTPQTVQVTFNVTAPPAISATPQSLSFFVPGNGATPAPQTITVISSGGNTNFTASAFSQGGNWLSVTGGGTTPGSVVVSVNPSGLTPGQSYNGSVTINAPASNPSSLQVAVTVTVAPQGAVPLQASPSALYLYYDQGAGSDLEHVLMLNTGGGSVSYQVAGQTQTCGSWLNVVTPTGTATASTPGVVGIDINPSGLNSQTCRGTITVTDSNANTATIPVYMAISSSTSSILLSQTAMNFVAGSGGSAPAGQTFTVLNPGTGSMSWNITTSTLSGGSWLSASPNSGTAPTLAQPGSPITVTVNPQGLAAGVYYGTVSVASSTASNGPQAITVSLTVLGSNPPAQVSPAGVILTGTNGSANTQTVNITNSGANSLTYSAIVTTDDGANWLTVSPTSGTVGTGATNALNVSATIASLSTGLRHGTLRLAFSDGTVQTVDVQLAIAGASSGATAVAACQPTSLAMEFLSPQQNYQAAAQVAVPVQVLVQDCFGNALTSSNTGVDVLAGTSNTDIRLNYTGNGIWSGTWTPSAAAAASSLTALAVEIVGGAEATGSITANVSTSAAGSNAPPLVSAVVNAGSFVMPGLVAPGAMVSIFGSSLTDGQNQVYSTPFPNTLEGAQFKVGGVAMPVFYASAGQVNAIVPIGLTADQRDQLIVVRDTTQSAPVDLLVADSDPGIFTINSQGQGAILVGGTSQIAAPSGSISGANAAPATAGQTISIFVAGLGTVSNPPADGSPSTGTSLTTVTPVVTIGGIPAQVTYSGLAPGEVGLYQVNVVVPAGATGSAVPVVITLGNAVSNSVTMAIM